MALLLKDQQELILDLDLGSHVQQVVLALEDFVDLGEVKLLAVVVAVAEIQSVASHHERVQLLREAQLDGWMELDDNLTGFVEQI